MTTQNLFRGIRSTLVAAVLSGTAATASATPLLSGNIEHIQSTQEQKGGSYERFNGFYKLPGEVKGYTFGEFYHDGTNFIKHNLSRKVAGPVSLASQIKSVNEPLTDAGLGLQVAYFGKSGSYAVAKLLPLWMNKEGNSVKNREVLGFAIGTDLGSKVSVGIFGEINLKAKSGAEWAYGECSVMYKVNKDWSFGYNPALRNKAKGSVIPRMESRFALQRKF